MLVKDKFKNLFETYSDMYNTPWLIQPEETDLAYRMRSGNKPLTSFATEATVEEIAVVLHAMYGRKWDKYAEIYSSEFELLWNTDATVEETRTITDDTSESGSNDSTMEHGETITRKENGEAGVKYGSTIESQESGSDNSEMKHGETISRNTSEKHSGTDTKSTTDSETLSGTDKHTIAGTEKHTGRDSQDSTTETLVSGFNSNNYSPGEKIVKTEGINHGEEINTTNSDSLSHGKKTESKGSESISHGETVTGTDTESHSGTDVEKATNSRTASETKGGEDLETKSTEATQQHGGVDKQQGSDARETHGTHTETYTQKRYGNIGVTTSVAMLTEALDFYHNTFMKHIMEDVDYAITLSIY